MALWLVFQASGVKVSLLEIFFFIIGFAHDFIFFYFHKPKTANTEKGGPQGFTNVYSFLKWIKNITGLDLPNC